MNWIYLSLLGVIGLLPFEGNYVFFLLFLLMLLYDTKKTKDSDGKSTEMFLYCIYV